MLIEIIIEGEKKTSFSQVLFSQMQVAAQLNKFI
jgi:hypothetical protein